MSLPGSGIPEPCEVCWVLLLMDLGCWSWKGSWEVDPVSQPVRHRLGGVGEWQLLQEHMVKQQRIGGGGGQGPGYLI